MSKRERNKKKNYTVCAIAIGRKETIVENAVCHSEQIEESLMNTYFVYILTNKANTVLYTGVTNNLLRRIYEHKEKKVDGFTKKYNLIKLIYFDQFNNVTEAIVAEKKIALIESINPEWKDLSLSF